MTHLSDKTRPLLLLTAVFLLQWLLLFSLKEPAWDAVSYYAYARSAVLDGDLDFGNDYRLSYPTAGKHFAGRAYDQILTPAGRVANLFAMGAGLLWLPWLTLLYQGAQIAGSAAEFSGYEPLFVGNLGLFSALLGLGAFWLAYCVARQAAALEVALAATVTMMFATPLLYYQYREPLYSHTAAAFTVALAVLFWWTREKRGEGGVWSALLMGGLLGLAGLVRWQNLIYLALPAFSAALALWRVPSSARRELLRSRAVDLFLVGLGALAVFSLQMAIWRVLYGSFLTIPQGQGFLDWRAAYLWPLLFSSFRGLLPWMPVFFLSAAGLLALGRRKPALGLPLLAMLALALYVNAGTRDWFAGGGFGPRRLTSELVLLVVGYAAMLQTLPARFRAWIAAVLGLLLGLQQWLLLRYALEDSLGGRVMSMMPTFTWEEVPLSMFAAQLAGYVPRAFVAPLDFLVLHGSPLHVLLSEGLLPWGHLRVILLTGSFAAVLVGLGVLLARRWPGTKGYALAVVVGTAVLVLANIWILTQG